MSNHNMRLECAYNILRSCHRRVIESEDYKEVYWIRNLSSGYVASGFFDEEKETVTV